MRSCSVRFRTDAIARQVVHALNNDRVVCIAPIDLVFQSAKHCAVFFLLIALQLKRFKAVRKLFHKGVEIGEGCHTQSLNEIGVNLAVRN